MVPRRFELEIRAEARSYPHPYPEWGYGTAGPEIGLKVDFMPSMTHHDDGGGGSRRHRRRRL